MTSISVFGPRNTHPTQSKNQKTNKIHHKNHEKVVLWPFVRKKLKIVSFFDHFTPDLTSNSGFGPRNTHPTQSQTQKINKNHHKNHEKVVLWSFVG